MSIFITILILGIIIAIHEFGHFITAKLFKIPVTEFALGMGPRLGGFIRGETTYSIRALPIGGYVNIAGMDPEEKSEQGFNSRPPYQKFIVLFAGVFMNFILAWILSFMMFFAVGESKPTNKPVIGKIEQNMPSSKLLKTGDIIKTIDGMPVTTWEEVYSLLVAKKIPQVTLEITRGNEPLAINALMEFNEKEDRYRLGISQEVTKTRYGFGDSVTKGTNQFFNLFTATFTGLKMIFTGKVAAKDISGPIGTVKVVEMFSSWGYEYLIFLTAILSVSVGVFNLLPFPALDGGRLIFVILELIGIKVSKKVEENLHRAGIMILLALTFFITINDINNLF